MPPPYRITAIEQAVLGRLRDQISYLHDSNFDVQNRMPDRVFITNFLSRVPRISVHHISTDYGQPESFEDYIVVSEKLFFNLVVGTHSLRSVDTMRVGIGDQSGLTQPGSVDEAGIYDLLFDAKGALAFSDLGLDLLAPVEILGDDMTDLGDEYDGFVIYIIQFSLTQERKFTRDETTTLS